MNCRQHAQASSILLSDHPHHSQVSLQNYTCIPFPSEQGPDHLERQCREDPSLLHQFGDGQHVVQWTQDLDEYDRWVAAQEAYVQQITAKLMKEKKPRAAARVMHYS